MKKQKADNKPASPQSPPTVVGVEWRRTAGSERCYLVAKLADGSEVRVATPDGHVPTVGG